MTSSVLSHKLVVIGDAGVGKTGLIKRLQSNPFEPKYIPTQGIDVNVTSLVFNTNKGDVTLWAYDFAGQERYGLKNEDFDEATCAIAMFDVTSRLSYNNLEFWIKALRRVKPDIPIVLCGNKAEINNRRIKPEDITMHVELELLDYQEISVRRNYQLGLPFLTIIKHFYGDDIEFIAQ